MSPSIYLAGPITGLTFENSESWRDVATNLLTPYGIRCFSPLRSQRSFFADRGPIIETSYEEHPMTTADVIMMRDHWDVQRTDLTLVYVMGAKEKSLGTAIEMGIAYAHRKPVVLVMEKSGNVHEHAMVRKIGVHCATTLYEGIELVKTLLLPG